VCGDLNLSVADILDLNDITEVSDTAVNLDLVLKELLEGGDVKDLVACGLGALMMNFLVTLACLPLADFYKSMILAYCITPQPRKRRANSKAISCTYC